MVEFAASLLAPFLPAPALVAWLAPVAAVYAAAAAAVVGRLRMRGMRTAYTRKLFHFAIFTVAGLIQVWAGLPGVVVFGSVVTLLVLFALWRGDGFPFYEALARPTDAPHRSLFIVIPLMTTALGGVVANLVAPAYAAVGYLVCGWGDAIGEPVGSRWGKHRYRVPSLAGVAATRSLEGSTAVLIAGTLAALLGLLLQGFTPTDALLIATAAGVAGTAAEAVSHHGLDNFTVQVAAAAAALWIGMRVAAA